MNIIAIIPARGGSKGIPNKNLLEVNGKPLLWYTLHRAKQSKYLNNIYVSSDSKKIGHYALDNGASWVLRPKKYLVIQLLLNQLYTTLLINYLKNLI